MQALKRLVVVSDTHVGSVVAPWPQGVRLEAGGTYEPNKFQCWLNECWQEMLCQLEAYRPFTGILNGDAIQGTNPRDGELITNNLNVQIDAAQQLLEPFFALCDGGRYLVRGTEWHEGKAAEYLELLGARLNVNRHPITGLHSWWEIFAGLEGIGDSEQSIMHFAHHISMSSVPWYEGTIPTRDLLLMFSELARFQHGIAPQLRMIVRSHRHRGVWVALPATIHALVTPGWQLRTAFVYGRSSSILPQIGYTVIEYDGDFMVRQRLFQLPAQHIEAM